MAEVTDVPWEIVKSFIALRSDGGSDTPVLLPAGAQVFVVRGPYSPDGADQAANATYVDLRPLRAAHVYTALQADFEACTLPALEKTSFPGEPE